MIFSRVILSGSEESVCINLILSRSFASLWMTFIRTESISKFRVQQLMNEVASALRPHQVHLRHHDTVLADMSAGATLGESLSGKLGIKHVLPALPVLDAHLAQTAVQLLGTHPQLLRQLRGGDAVDRVQHRVGILGSRLQLGYLLVTLRQGRLRNSMARFITSFSLSPFFAIR